MKAMSEYPVRLEMQGPETLTFQAVAMIERVYVRILGTS
jgi:hypothetical protein